jgi:formylglycine-generating enzyme required for sulfatase activity
MLLHGYPTMTDYRLMNFSRVLFLFVLIGLIAPGRAAGSANPPGEEMEFVRIPPGEFEMGCSLGDSKCRFAEKPAHHVKITKPFEMETHEVTQQQWQSVMGKNPSWLKIPSLPVARISWNDIQHFLKKLNSRKDGYRYRLPTEAEWEYAARAATRVADYPGAQDPMATYGKRPKGYVVHGDKNASAGKIEGEIPVQIKPNAFGLFDMLGSMEWVEDWFDSYPASAQIDPKGPGSGRERVVRGGDSGPEIASGDLSNSYREVRISNRDSLSPDTRVLDIAFRCVRESVR